MIAKLDSKEAKEGSNYFMIFNDVNLGKLMSKMHSTVIRTGNELENVIKKKASKMMIEDLSVFLASSKSGTYVLTKKTISAYIKKEKLTTFEIVPDLIIFTIDDVSRCYILELKLGSMFDTKKVKGESSSMTDVYNWVKKNVGDSYKISTHYCAFMESDKEKIVEGFKRKISKDQAMTGLQLCEILNINYENIKSELIKDSEYNYNYFVDELLKIETANEKIRKALSENENKNN